MKTLRRHISTKLRRNPPPPLTAICRPACPTKDKRESQLPRDALMTTCRGSCFLHHSSHQLRGFDVRPAAEGFTTSAIWWTLLCKRFLKLTCRPTELLGNQQSVINTTLFFWLHYEVDPDATRAATPDFTIE